jgi:carbamoyl-phosphate synthase large subunit
VARLNVLITAASRRVALVQAFQRALKRPGVSGQVLVTDVNPLSPAVHVADRAFRVPFADEPDYLHEIQAICEANGVGLIVPTIDDELPLFAAAAGAFQKAGIKVAVSEPRTTTICNDKLATCDALRAAGIVAAETWLPESLPEDTALPLFVKPRGGRGGVQAFPAGTKKELKFFTSYVKDAVVQRYLNGPEFTLDVLCDFRGHPLSVVPRERAVIRAGVTDRGRTSDDRALIDLALACTKALPFAAAINIQCRVVDGVPTVFEINPRFSGGIPLTIAAGADFPAMLVDLVLGRRVAPSIGRFTPGLWMSSYETSVFLERPERTLELCPRLAAEDVA